MKIRIKFAKRNSMKFISHLDVMRYFQKVIKRANIDIAYSEGFNPHQIMSFASPLGLGLTSEAEYVDIEVKSLISTAEALTIMNSVSVPDMPILSFKLLDDSATKAMTLVAASDYYVEFRRGYEPSFDFDNALNDLLSKDTFIITKETKKSTKEIDLRPLIYDVHKENDGYFLKLAAGSVNNLKPELIFKTVYENNNSDFDDISLLIKRVELYGYKEGIEEPGINDLIPLESFGEDIE